MLIKALQKVEIRAYARQCYDTHDGGLFAPTPFQSGLNQYGPPMGMESLKGAICTYYNKHYDLEGGGGGKRAITPENVLVRNGRLAGVPSHPRRPRA